MLSLPTTATISPILVIPACPRRPVDRLLARSRPGGHFWPRLIAPGKPNGEWPEHRCRGRNTPYIGYGSPGGDVVLLSHFPRRRQYGAWRSPLGRRGTWRRRGVASRRCDRPTLPPG